MPGICELHGGYTNLDDCPSCLGGRMEGIAQAVRGEGVYLDEAARLRRALLSLMESTRTTEIRLAGDGPTITQASLRAASPRVDPN